jgi:biotin synthase
VHMCSCAPFIPTENTPLRNEPAGDPSLTLNVLAVMRLVNPKWLIPSVSALEQRTSGGQLAGLKAGANVVTINFSPQVRKKTYLIYGKHRYLVTSSHVKSLLASSGLSAHTSYWIES